MDTSAVGYEVDFLPVGTGEKCGDAIALRFGKLLTNPPQQTVVVIDGGFQDSGEKLVEHIRTYYKPEVVDAVVSTHPDDDHASGLEVVLNELKVKCLLMHLPWKHTQDTARLFQDDRVTDESVKAALRKSLDTARNLEKLAAQKKINIVELFAGVRGFGGAMRVLGPTQDFYRSLLPGYRGTPEPKAGFSSVVTQAVKEVGKKIAERWGHETLEDTGETSAENNSSAVLLFTIGGQSLLFTADAGIPALTQAVGRLQSEGFNFSTLNFVQVPHHGSQRNMGPTLLNKIVGPKQPQAPPNHVKTAVVSVSPDSAPKHPSKKVTNAFLRRGAPVHVTAGSKTLHHHNSPDRGWVNSTPIPFYHEVEE